MPSLHPAAAGDEDLPDALDPADISANFGPLLPLVDEHGDEYVDDALMSSEDDMSDDEDMQCDTAAGSSAFDPFSADM